MKNQELSPRDALEHTLARWWVVVLITVLGGIAGWVFHFLHPPIYEATAIITVNMDFQKRELTQYEEDYAFGVADAIITSTGVKNQIIAEAQTGEFPTKINQPQQQMFLERKQSVWELHILNRDPKVATELANLWAEKSNTVLNAALEHALRAEQIQDQIDSITRSQPASGSSGLGTEIQATLQNLSSELLQEQQLSLGLISIMKFALTGSAVVPEKPVLYYLANLVLAGACIGFIISLWVVNSYKVQHRD